MKTYVARKDDIKSEWYLFDADGRTLGRLATQIAVRLMGKHRPIYTPHIDSGDHVVVVNATGVKLTGKKHDEKLYHRSSDLDVPGRAQDFHLRAGG